MNQIKNFCSFHKCENWVICDNNKWFCEIFIFGYFVIGPKLWPKLQKDSALPGMWTRKRGKTARWDWKLAKKINFCKSWHIDLSFSLFHSLYFLQCFRFKLEKPSATLDVLSFQLIELIEGKVCSLLCRQCNSSSEPQKFKFSRLLMQLGVCVAFGCWTPS